MIIGLSGYAQSGKDTVAKYLVEERGFERIAFADPIRDLLYEMNPIISLAANEPMYLRPRVDHDGWDQAKKNPEVRRLLQELGVGARKRVDEDIWVIAALRKMDEEAKNYVVTDVRFQNEAVMIKQASGHLWRVERQGVGPVNNHVSEHDLDNWEFDSFLHNNGSIEDLKFAVKTRLMQHV
jgi:hypothetical protein